MICPYIQKSLKQVTQTVHETDESYNEKRTQVVILEEYTQMECKKDECGAWRDGRCTYNR